MTSVARPAVAALRAESWWLIESPRGVPMSGIENNEGWWYGRESGHDRFSWDVEKAVRFRSKADAEAVKRAAGIGSWSTEITEHVWMGAALEAPPPLDKILEVMRDKSPPDDLALSEIQNYLKIAGYDVPLRSYRGDDPPERLSAWVAASTSVRQALTVVCPYCAAVVGIYCDPVGTFVHAARIDVAVRGEAPPEPLLEVDEIKRRLAVYAVSIDGFDSLNEGQQELLTDIAIWVCRELERVRAISPSQEGVQGEGSAP